MPIIKGGERVEIGGLTFYVISTDWFSSDPDNPAVQAMLMTEPALNRIGVSVNRDEG